MTYGHLRADCLYIGISCGPNARYRVWESIYLFIENAFGTRDVALSNVSGRCQSLSLHRVKQTVQSFSAVTVAASGVVTSGELGWPLLIIGPSIEAGCLIPYVQDKRVDGR